MQMLLVSGDNARDRRPARGGGDLETAVIMVWRAFDRKPCTSIAVCSVGCGSCRRERAASASSVGLATDVGFTFTFGGTWCWSVVRGDIHLPRGAAGSFRRPWLAPPMRISICRSHRDWSAARSLSVDPAEKNEVARPLAHAGRR